MSPYDTNEVAETSVERAPDGAVTYRCARCRQVVDSSEWHPVTTSDDGERVYLFCSDECLREWQAGTRD